MKKYFVFTLQGRDWWKPALVFWVVYLLLFGGQQVVLRLGNPTAVGLNLLVSLLVTVLLVLLEAIVTIVLLRIVAGKISFNGNTFSFSGATREFAVLNLKGILLSIVTVGFSAPWYLRNILAYLASHTTYGGAPFQFMGSPRKLLGYFVLALYVPMVVVIVALSVAAIVVSMRGDNGSPREMARMATVVTAVAVLFVLIPFTYLVLTWYVDVQWARARVTLHTRFWPSCGLVLGQVLLTVITAGIYGPAGYLRLYRYLGRTAVTRGEAPAARLGFDGDIGRGFGVIWGQGLLCLVTLGFFSPWAYARVARWLLGSTFIEHAA